MSVISETGTLKMPDVQFKSHTYRVIGHERTKQIRTWKDLRHYYLFRNKGGKLVIASTKTGRVTSVTAAHVEFDLFPIGSYIDLPERVR